MTEVEIRAFAEADYKPLLALSGRAGEGAPTASLWGDAESEAAVYLTPYLDLEPESGLIIPRSAKSPCGGPPAGSGNDQRLRTMRGATDGTCSRRWPGRGQVAGRVARCSATAPRARLRHATSAQPAFAMRRASSGWAGQSRIDSPRYV
jgi:hypothetical protein